MWVEMHASAFPPSETHPALVAVLAGGMGRRLGGEKATAPLGGRPLISYAVQAALDAGLQTVVLAKRRSCLPALRSCLHALGCPMVLEPDEPRHPLCGIVAALAYAERPVLAVGCDMPFVTPSLLEWLARMPGAAVVCVQGAAQPLLARYLPEQLPALERALDERASMRRTVDSLKLIPISESQLTRFGDPQTLCFNVNHPTDLARAEGLLGGRGGGAAAV